MAVTVVTVMEEPAAILEAVLNTDPSALAVAESVTMCACTLARGMPLVRIVSRWNRLLYLCL